MTTGTQEQLAAPGKVWQTGLIAAGIASVINLVIYFIADAAGVSFTFFPPEIPAPPFALAVVFATVAGILAGTFVLTLLPRFTPYPIRSFRVIAIVVLFLSFAQPFLLNSGLFPTPEPVGTDTILVLELMHVVAGVAAIALLTTRARA